MGQLNWGQHWWPWESILTAPYGYCVPSMLPFALPIRGAIDGTLRWHVQGHWQEVHREAEWDMFHVLSPSSNPFSYE